MRTKLASAGTVTVLLLGTTAAAGAPQVSPLSKAGGGVIAVSGPNVFSDNGTNVLRRDATNATIIIDVPRRADGRTSCGTGESDGADGAWMICGTGGSIDGRRVLVHVREDGSVDALATPLTRLDEFERAVAGQGSAVMSSMGQDGSFVVVAQIGTGIRTLSFSPVTDVWTAQSLPGVDLSTFHTPWPYIARGRDGTVAIQWVSTLGSTAGKRGSAAQRGVGRAGASRVTVAVRRAGDVTFGAPKKLGLPIPYVDTRGGVVIGDDGTVVLSFSASDPLNVKRGKVDGVAAYSPKTARWTRPVRLSAAVDQNNAPDALAFPTATGVTVIGGVAASDASSAPARPAKRGAPFMVRFSATRLAVKRVGVPSARIVGAAELASGDTVVLTGTSTKKPFRLRSGRNLTAAIRAAGVAMPKGRWPSPPMAFRALDRSGVVLSSSGGKEFLVVGKSAAVPR